MWGSMQAAEPCFVGWDVGGAHLKACWMQGGQVLDVAQWPCPLWQGLQHLDEALAAAQQRWPAARQATHAVAMSGEMVDLFAHREEGVQRISALLAARLSDSAQAVQVYAGDSGWCAPDQAAARWPQVASANWLATAQHTALALQSAQPSAVLVDIGSTTSDFIALRQGRVLCHARSDVQRLASGELFYQGVVRTPLCALAPRIHWRGQRLNVMNEFFATTADVYRLLGELPAAHDQQAPADNAAKDAAATQQRLARMIGLDAREGTPQDWLHFAQSWRSEQLAQLQAQLAQVKQLHGLPDDVALVSAGCGDFLVPELGGATGRVLRYADDVARVAAQAPAGTRDWVQVCAPSVAVAALLTRELR
jgi:(4-(4-[2-(gamma-L-glutamylamino)ethyl]phenoxymethyl)furan-2-yl)methanamine synthase